MTQPTPCPTCGDPRDGGMLCSNSFHRGTYSDWQTPKAVSIPRQERSVWAYELVNKMLADKEAEAIQRFGGDSIVRVTRNKEDGTMEVLDLEIRRVGMIYEHFQDNAGDIS